MEPMVVFALGEPEHCADEIRWAMDLYPFRAGMLPSTAGGRPPDDPIFEPMWSLIEQLGLLIFLHPTSAVALPARTEFIQKHSRTGRSPCVTAVGVAGLMHPDMLIEVEATAVFE
jgi:hypothetical protein